MDAVANVKCAQELAANIRPTVGGFPYLAEALRLAGVSSIRQNVAGGTALYLTVHGAVVQQTDTLIQGSHEVAAWSSAALVDAIRADQSGKSTFDEFLAGCWAAGVVDYEVDLLARRCRYHGATGESYEELYPAVNIAAITTDLAVAAAATPAAHHSG